MVVFLVNLFEYFSVAVPQVLENISVVWLDYLRVVWTHFRPLLVVERVIEDI